MKVLIFFDSSNRIYFMQRAAPLVTALTKLLLLLSTLKGSGSIGGDTMKADKGQQPLTHLVAAMPRYNKFNMRQLSLVDYHHSWRGSSSDRPLRLDGVVVPIYKFRGEDAQLECKYDKGTDPLYSVKWYKDDQEFFRYLFGKSSPKKVFKPSGVIVDILQSNERRVLLRDVSFNSTGVYRCEVSADAPHFRTFANQSVMVVVELPDRPPHVTGGRSHYRVGETAKLNCTSIKSKPVAHLDWYINGEKAPEVSRIQYVPWRHRDGLESRRLGLSFQIDESHFVDGVMSLKCKARVAAIYTAEEEEEAHNLGEPLVLEQKEQSILVFNGTSAPTFQRLLVIVLLASLAQTT